MRDSALKLNNCDQVVQAFAQVGEELMRDSALKQVIQHDLLPVVQASEKSSCATAL